MKTVGSQPLSHQGNPTLLAACSPPPQTLIIYAASVSGYQLNEKGVFLLAVSGANRPLCCHLQSPVGQQSALVE